MRHALKSLALAVVAALALSACSKQEAPPAPAAAAPAPVAAKEPCTLNVFIWSEYMDPEIIKAFEQKYSCKVTIDLYEDNESMIAKLQGGGTSLYDIVVPGNYVVAAMVKLDLLAPLRKENIPNLKNLDDKFVSPAYDRDNKYTAAYQWGTVGIYTRKKPGQAVDETWGLLFDPKAKPGAFLMMDSIREMMGSALKYKGYSVNTTDQKQLKEAADLLAAAKKRSQGFEGGVGGKNKVLAKAVKAAVVYNGDAVKGTKDDPETYYFVPREGGVIWVDNLAIPSKAPHRETAEKFIDFILDPKVGAQLSDFNQYATPNKAARALVNADDGKNPAIYPPPEMMAKLEFVEDLGEQNRLFDEIWTMVKSK
ncbi:MAG: spermidine/putrescine ABC transporter substrate-binding protein [Anaeromyxobacter sp.]|nr:spermidine/putrescine ABC transporter substrate-binding protein [Anaeromyxobacter sp.]MBL0276739.1 spermidine/putrescine ABC transporter substrate-binding protein [Anaeromyxobacter sp.]